MTLGSCESPSGRRHLVLLILGIGLMVVVLVVTAIGVTAGAKWRPGQSQPLVPGVEAAGPSADAFLHLDAAVVVREGLSSVDFRPRGGASLGTKVVFLDSGSDSLFSLSRDGSYSEVPLELAATPGIRKPQFTGLASTSTDVLLIADLMNGQVWRYASDGRLLGGFLSDAQRHEALLTKPTGVTVDGEGRVIVADAGDHSVKVFNKAGNLVYSMGGEGFAVGKLDHPNGLVAGTDGLVYVADTNNRRIQVFDGMGRSVSLFPAGANESNLLLPRSIGLDSMERLHVVDSFSGAVYVFQLDGLYLGSYGSAGPAADHLSLPEGLVIAGDWVVVGDRGNGRLMIYSE